MCKNKLPTSSLSKVIVLHPANACQLRVVTFDHTTCSYKAYNCNHHGDRTFQLFWDARQQCIAAKCHNYCSVHCHGTISSTASILGKDRDLYTVIL